MLDKLVFVALPPNIGAGRVISRDSVALIVGAGHAREFLGYRGHGPLLQVPGQNIESYPLPFATITMAGRSTRSFSA